MSTVHFMQLEAMAFGQRKKICTNICKKSSVSWSSLLSQFPKYIAFLFPQTSFFIIPIRKNILLDQKKPQTAKTSRKMFQLHLTK